MRKPKIEARPMRASTMQLVKHAMDDFSRRLGEIAAVAVAEGEVNPKEGWMPDFPAGQWKRTRP